MDMREFQERVAEAMRASGRENARFMAKITVVLLATVMLAAGAVVLLGGGSALLAVACAGLLVGMFSVMLYCGRESDRVQRRVHVKTPCCGQGVSQQDQKIIIASRHCPYCGKRIINEDEQATRTTV